MKILIGFTARDFTSIDHERGKEVERYNCLINLNNVKGLRKCREILSTLHCVMELQSVTDQPPTITRLLDV